VALERKLTVEFIGTFFLVFTIGMAVATGGALAPLAIAAALVVTAIGYDPAGAAYAFLFIQGAEKPQGDLRPAEVQETA